MATTKKKAASKKASTKKKHTGPDPCWKGFEQLGMKMKDGRKVPDCIPKKK
jgi:hypothetical protein